MNESQLIADVEFIYDPGENRFNMYIGEQLAGFFYDNTGNIQFKEIKLTAKQLELIAKHSRNLYNNRRKLKREKDNIKYNELKEMKKQALKEILQELYGK